MAHSARAKRVTSWQPWSPLVQTKDRSAGGAPAASGMKHLRSSLRSEGGRGDVFSRLLQEGY